MKHNRKNNTNPHTESPKPDIFGGPASVYPTGGCPWPIDEVEESLKGCTRYIISRNAVESCDVAQLIHDLRPSLDNPLFAAGPGKVIFKVEGYGINPRHLVLVPEFRGFIQKVEESHPCWFYFSWPYSNWPSLIALACSEQLAIRNVDHNNLQFGMDRDELGEFLRSQVGALEHYCAAMDISEDATVNHLEQLFVRSFPDYLGDEEAD